MYKAWPSDTPHDRFVDQFEWDDGDFLYRYRNVGPAYRVTTDERDDFIEAYDRWERWLLPIAFALSIGLLAILFIMLPPLAPGRGNVTWGVSSPVLGFTARWFGELLAFDAPRRKLQDRSPVAPALPDADRRRIALDRISVLNELFSAIAITALIAFMIFMTTWPARPIELLLIVGCGAMVVWSLVQATRKWIAPEAADAS